MTARQENFRIRGEAYESHFKSITSSLLSVVRVPLQDDYGIDSYCQVLQPLRDDSSTVAGSFGVQIGGPTKKYELGGEGREYESHWLRTVALPMYLARVSSDFSAVDLYSLAPIAMVLGQVLHPFKVVCTFRKRANVAWAQQLPESVKYRGDNPFADGQIWTVPCGPPFLSFTQAELNEPPFLENVRRLLNWRLMVDRSAYLRTVLGVVVLDLVREWHTNDFGCPTSGRFMHFRASGMQPGQNIEHLAGVLEPIYTALTEHLQIQNNPEARVFEPVLHWLHGKQFLSEYGQGLLKKFIGADS